MREDERLRIVSDALWQRVKARQAQQSKTAGAKVKSGLRQRKAGAGRPARYLLSGVLRCGVCGASFTLSNGPRYQCASHVNGRACSNTISVRRSLVKSRILDSVKSELKDPRLVAEVETRLRRALKARRKPADNGARLAELRDEVANLADAVAGGLLKSSPALAQRLTAAETELARLEVAHTPKPAPSVARVIPRVRERVHAMVDRLDTAMEQETDRARAALQDVIGTSVTLQPDESGAFLWAEFGIETAPLVQAAVASEIMVAGDRYGFIDLAPRPKLPHIPLIRKRS